MVIIFHSFNLIVFQNLIFHGLHTAAQNKSKETKRKKGSIRYSGELESVFEMKITDNNPYHADHTTRSYLMEIV